MCLLINQSLTIHHIGWHLSPACASQSAEERIVYWPNAHCARSIIQSQFTWSPAIANGI